MKWISIVEWGWLLISLMGTTYGYFLSTSWEENSTLSFYMIGVAWGGFYRETTKDLRLPISHWKQLICSFLSLI